VHTHLQCRTIEWMSFAEELAKLANLGILDHDGSLLGFRGNHIVNRQARGGGNSNCRWAGILIVADHHSSGKAPTHKWEVKWITQVALPVFRAVGVGWFAVNCFSAMTYGGRLAILFTGRKPLSSSDLR